LIPPGESYESFKAATSKPVQLFVTWPDENETKQQQSFRSRWAQYFDQDMRLSCHGDEYSLCCPLDFDRQAKLQTVHASGVLKETVDSVSGESHLALVLDSLCLPDEPYKQPWYHEGGDAAPVEEVVSSDGGSR
jgi:hypothetical protein